MTGGTRGNFLVGFDISHSAPSIVKSCQRERKKSRSRVHRCWIGAAVSQIQTACYFPINAIKPDEHLLHFHRWLILNSFIYHERFGCGRQDELNTWTLSGAKVQPQNVIQLLHVFQHHMNVSNLLSSLTPSIVLARNLTQGVYKYHKVKFKAFKDLFKTNCVQTWD